MFVTQGPLDPESRLFVGRSAELTLMEAWLVSVRCVGAVLGARQTGKTSLLLKLRHLLKGKYACVFVDLEAVTGAELPECIAYIASEILGQLGEQLGAADIALPKTSNEFLAFLDTCARAVKSVRIVVLLDEIGSLPPPVSLRLTSAIRAVFTTRYVKPEFARYVFVVAGATDALDVTASRNSPLKNVAETLYLDDLSATETDQLVMEMFGEAAPAPHEDLGRILRNWTNGHPYWTQRLGEALHRDIGDITESSVRSVVEHLLDTEDRNLPYVFRALDADQTLREFAGALVAGTPIGFTRANATIARLELIGLLRNDRGYCAIRNRIYQEALHRDPVRHARQPARDFREFQERLSRASDIETLLQSATLHLQNALQSRSVVALIAQPNHTSLVVAATVGLGEVPVAGTRFQASERFLSALTTCCAPTDIEHAPTDADWLVALATALVVPVRVKDSVVAVFCLGSKISGETYGPEAREFASGLGGQAAAAIDRMRLQGLERDAERAWEIQRGLLPAVLPQLGGLQIAGSCQPARVVSGDYYDAFDLSDQVVVICVGDVVGKGMPAALLMANLQAAVKALSCETMNPSRLCEAVNRVIARNVRPGEFITFFYAIVEVASRRLRYTNAGHNPPVLVRGDGAVVRLDVGGPLLGIFPDWVYEEHTLAFEPGDRLVLFTDGVTEVRNAEGEEFGDERVIAVARAALDAPALHRGVIEAVRQFSSGVFHDDVTVLAVTRSFAGA